MRPRFEEHHGFLFSAYPLASVASLALDGVPRSGFSFAFSVIFGSAFSQWRRKRLGVGAGIDWKPVQNHQNLSIVLRFGYRLGGRLMSALDGVWDFFLCTSIWTMGDERALEAGRWRQSSNR